MDVQSILGLRQQIRVLVHRAVLLHNYTGCYFMNVTNKSLSRDVETTHVWFAGDPEIHVLNPQRVLPRRLRPDESWETWIEARLLPTSVRDTAHTLARVRLSKWQSG
jgi:hypothetical protein